MKQRGGFVSARYLAQIVYIKKSDAEMEIYYEII